MMLSRGRMIGVNGISLHVEDHGAGDPVLLLHGWPDSAFLWRNQIPFLVPHGFRVIAPDMRGFGRSGRPGDVAAYALRHAVADVAAILDALGLEAAHLVGHDWGAAVAWLAAMFHPGRVRKPALPPLLPLTRRPHESCRKRSACQAATRTLLPRAVRVWICRLNHVSASTDLHSRPRRHCGLRLSRNARIPSRASGSWLVAAITSMA
jgi:pimeloyl-ACP methyl ester carboxylesterase